MSTNDGTRDGGNDSTEVIDLTSESPTGGKFHESPYCEPQSGHEVDLSAVQAETPSPPGSPRYGLEITLQDIEKKKEETRGNIARYLVLTVAVLSTLPVLIVGLSPLYGDPNREIENLVKVLQVVYSPIIALLGSALGYYFGSSSKEK